MIKNNCEQIHETVIRDIVDVLTDIKSSGILSKLGSKKSFRSIAQASSNLVLVFPVATDRGISVQNASMICKAIERKAVSMLQMLFSAISISNASDVLEYIKQFHTNINFSSKVTIDEFMDALDTLVSTSESAGLCTVDRDVYNKISEDMRNINYFLPEVMSEYAVNHFVVKKDYYGRQEIVNEAPSLQQVPSYVPDNNASSKDIYDASMRTQKMKDDRYFNAIKANNDTKKLNHSIRQDANRTKMDIDRYNQDDEHFYQKLKFDDNKYKGDFIRNQLLDSDVKKANELIPTSMLINFVSTSDPNGPIDIKNSVIGVKAKLYPIESNDIIDRIKIKNKDKQGFVQFIRASTREISFWKDLVFALDTAKLDAFANSKRGSTNKMWKVLERRGVKSKLNRSFGFNNTAAAITTLVVSQETAEMLKKYENIDIEKPNVIRPIMEAYNFMGVCIVDETLECAKFIFDSGDDIYELLSFNNLERESNDSSYKKVINLMTKMSR